MRKYTLIVLVALLPTIAGCAGLQRLETAWGSITSSTISPKGVYVAAKIFDALEATATNYLRLQRCAPATQPICRDPTVTPKLIQAIRQGRGARDTLITFQRAHPGSLGDQGTYDLLQTSIKTITDVLQNYVGATP